MPFRLRTQNFYIYYYHFYYILNIELLQNYNIKNAPISQYILQLFLSAFVWYTKQSNIVAFCSCLNWVFNYTENFSNGIAIVTLYVIFSYYAKNAPNLSNISKLSAIFIFYYKNLVLFWFYLVYFFIFYPVFYYYYWIAF